MKPNRSRRRPAPPKRNKQPPPEYDEVPELYPGEVGVLLASGPSLNEQDLAVVKQFRDKGLVRVFGLGDSYRLCDFMDVFYACDPKWWELNPEVLNNPCTNKWTQDVRAAKKYKLNLVSGSSGKGISTRKNHIHFGSNSGYQLLNLAYHFGIRKFILLGYNMDVPKGMQQHFFGKHPKGLNQTNNYRSFVANYNGIQDNIKQMVINSTTPTGLTCFRKLPLEQALEETTTKRRSGEVAVQSAPEEPAVPREPSRTYLPGIYGGPSSDGSEPNPRATRHFKPCAYGGPM